MLCNCVDFFCVSDSMLSNCDCVSLCRCIWNFHVTLNNLENSIQKCKFFQCRLYIVV